MRVFRGLPNPQSRVPCALTIGNFDGVHRGHQVLLAEVRAAATRLCVSATVMTFEPHPREFFSRLKPGLGSAPTRIAPLRDKLEALARQGIERVIVERFNEDFARQSAEAFIEHTLVAGCHVRWLMVGDDFRFGARRVGNFEMLEEAGARFGFEVHSLPTVTENSQRVSSSAVRAALAEGDLVRAEALLGHPYFVSGHVIHGRKLGRTIGFPTINLRVAHHPAAVSGIFVVRVHGVSETPLGGVASLGVRPTVEESGRILLEVHLFDFAQNLYGRLVRVEFLKKLRDEEKFDDLTSLGAAIAEDSRQARAFLGLTPVSENFATSATDRIS